MQAKRGDWSQIPQFFREINGFDHRQYSPLFEFRGSMGFPSPKITCGRKQSGPGWRPGPCLVWWRRRGLAPRVQKGSDKGFYERIPLIAFAGAQPAGGPRGPAILIESVR